MIYLIIVTNDNKFKPEDNHWKNNSILFESNLATNKAAALSYFKKNNLFLKFEKKAFVYIRKKNSNIIRKIDILIEKPKSDIEEIKSQKRKEKYASLTPEEKEKLLSKNRVNRPKLKSIKKAPIWFAELIKLPEGKYLAKDISKKLGISDNNLKIVLRKRGIEPAGKDNIDGYYLSYYYTSQFKQISNKEIEEAKNKLKM